MVGGKRVDKFLCVVTGIVQGGQPGLNFRLELRVAIASLPDELKALVLRASERRLKDQLNLLFATAHCQTLPNSLLMLMMNRTEQTLCTTKREKGLPENSLSFRQGVPRATGAGIAAREGLAYH